jgi:hypothetical protein
MMRPVNALVDLMSRIPARVQVKLFAAFLAIEILLVLLGAVALQVLAGVSDRTDELIRLQRKIEAYRQVQNDTTSQLYGVSTALVSRRPISPNRGSLPPQATTCANRCMH